MKALALYCVCATNLFWLTAIPKFDLYREHYPSLDTIHLVFAAEEEYDRMMKEIDGGGYGGIPQIEKRLFKMATYIDELRHREVGDIDASAAVVKQRAQDYMARNHSYTP